MPQNMLRPMRYRTNPEGASLCRSAVPALIAKGLLSQAKSGSNDQQFVRAVFREVLRNNPGDFENLPGCADRSCQPARRTLRVWRFRVQSVGAGSSRWQCATCRIGFGGEHHFGGRLVAAAIPAPDLERSKNADGVDGTELAHATRCYAADPRRCCILCVRRARAWLVVVLTAQFRLPEAMITGFDSTLLAHTVLPVVQFCRLTLDETPPIRGSALPRETPQTRPSRNLTGLGPAHPSIRASGRNTTRGDCRSSFDASGSQNTNRILKQAGLKRDTPSYLRRAKGCVAAGRTLEETTGLIRGAIQMRVSEDAEHIAAA